MIQFVKDSIRELKHVVWPTRKETQKSFGMVLLLLVVFSVYLFLFSNIFSEILFQLKNTINPRGNTQIEGVQINPEDIFINEEAGTGAQIIEDEALFGEEEVSELIPEDVSEISEEVGVEEPSPEGVTENAGE